MEMAKKNKVELQPNLGLVKQEKEGGGGEGVAGGEQDQLHLPRVQRGAQLRPRGPGDEEAHHG